MKIKVNNILKPDRQIPDYLFVGACDGALYDTRKSGWHALKPLRANYQTTHRDINSSADLKATLRNGKWVWPGGYPLFFITSDGAAICFDCARKELRHILPSIKERSSDGWRIVACDVNWEDTNCFCDNCSKQIESAYGDDDGQTKAA